MRGTMLAVALALGAASPMVTAAEKGAVQAATPMIVDTAFVKDALKRQAIVWDVRRAEDYQKGHIPGAVNIGDAGKVLRNDSDEDYIPLPALEKVLGDGGIDPAKEIVVYGDKGNPFVYFGLLTIQYLGGTKVHVYHGGMDDWKAAGEPVSTEAAKAAPVALRLTPRRDVTVSTAEVVKLLGKKGVQIVDARSPKEYGGEDIRALRGGHIPGAVNIPYEQNWTDPATPQKLARKEVANKDGLALKSPEQLKALYASLDPKRETVVYCQSGVRASETATVLRDMGFRKVRVYDSSWLGYGNTLSAPAANLTFVNVGALNGRIDALQKRVDGLEKQLADARQTK